MISENKEYSKEYSIDNLLSIENISPTTLSLLKQLVYGKKGEKERLEEKVKSIERSIKKVKDDTKSNENYLPLGICLLVLGKIDNALETLDSVKSKTKAYFFVGKCYQELGKYKDALVYFEHALDKNASKNDYSVQIEIAVAKRKSGDAQGAKQIIKNIIKINSDDPELHYQLGHCLDDIGKKEEAVAAYERALELNPDHPYALFRMAYNYDLNQMDDRAIELYERCNQLPVKYVNCFLNLGILYDDRGEYEKAISCYRSVLKSDPNNLRAQMYLKDAKMSLDMYYDENDSKKQSKCEDVLNIPISEFELSVRSRNCLEKMLIKTLGDLTKVSEQELLSYKNFGETSLYEIRNILKQKGLRLGQALENHQDNQIINDET